MGWPLGILFGFGSALASSVGFLMRHRGASAAPDVEARHPLRTAIALFRQKWWALGYLVAFGAWALHVVALKLAPLSLVQASLATSFVFLGVAAERLFGLEVGRRQWAGIALATVALAVLGATSASAQPEGREASYGGWSAAAFVGVLALIAFALIAASRARGVRRWDGIVLAAAAGLLFTITHIAVKALSGGFEAAWLPVVVGGFVVAFFASARSLQVGEAVSVIAMTGATSNVSAIVAGMVVFGDPVGDSPAIVALRMGAFLLVVVSAALMPAPVRAASRERSEPVSRARPGGADGRAARRSAPPRTRSAAPAAPRR